MRCSWKVGNKHCHCASGWRSEQKAPARSLQSPLHPIPGFVTVPHPGWGLRIHVKWSCYEEAPGPRAARQQDCCIVCQTHAGLLLLPAIRQLSTSHALIKHLPGSVLRKVHLNPCQKKASSFSSPQIYWKPFTHAKALSRSSPCLALG